MNDVLTIHRQRADRRQLQQIIAGLTEGVILIDPDQRIFWANGTALAMHGVDKLEDLGATVTEYRQRYELMDKGRVAGAARQLKGSVKEALGKITGDKKTQAEGRAEKAAGKAQNAAGGVKDTLRDAVKR